MWIFLSQSFLSIVAVKDKPEILVVRSRISGDIEYVFPEAEVLTDIGSDYKYRAFLSRKRVAEAIATEVMNINYTNFKKSVNPYNRELAYFDVWARMIDYQLQENSNKISGDY